jgi:hypothetical protein
MNESDKAEYIKEWIKKAEEDYSAADILLR